MTDTNCTPEDFVASFKPHTGYDAPSLTIRGSSAADLADRIAAAEATGLFAIVGNAHAAFKAAYLLGNDLGAAPVEHPSTVQNQGNHNNSGQPASNTPGAPTCPHGTKTYKTGFKKDGSPWKAWMCPARQGDPSQCKPEWIN